MRTLPVAGLLLLSTVITGCSFQNMSTPAIPTAPGGVPGSSTPVSTSPSGGSPASAFSGTWASSTIAGLPIGQCADLKWTITAQTATSIAGTVSATCSNGATVAANLSGQMQGESTITLNASGTITMMTLPCTFNLVGTGTRQSNDSMKIDYIGTYCLGNVGGSDMLRRFPNL